MIDVSKVKSRDKLYCLRFERIYEPDDNYYSIDLPIGVKSFYVKEVGITPTHHWIKSRLNDYYTNDELYYTKDDALKDLYERLKVDWEYFKCDEMIKKLLKVQEIVGRIK